MGSQEQEISCGDNIKVILFSIRIELQFTEMEKTVSILTDRSELQSGGQDW